MEMYIGIIDTDNFIMFKIDLIVWKSIHFDAVSSSSCSFKIDLIVWKSTVTGACKDTINQFKIDLIVWKFVIK